MAASTKNEHDKAPLLRHDDEIQYQMMDVVDMIFEEGNPVGIKALLAVLGDVDTSIEVRLPLVVATESLQEKLKQFTHAFC